MWIRIVLYYCCFRSKREAVVLIQIITYNLQLIYFFNREVKGPVKLLKLEIYYSLKNFMRHHIRLHSKHVPL